MAKKIIDNQSGNTELGREVIRAGEHWISVKRSAGTVTLNVVQDAGTESESPIPIQDGVWESNEARLIRVAAQCTVSYVGSDDAADVSVWRD